jgi:hypothetical protein
MDRRTFLKWCSILAATPVLGKDRWSPNFQYTLLQVGKHWKERERALVKLSYEIQKRCNIPVETDAIHLPLSRCADAHSPFFIISGKGSFKEPDLEEARELRQVLRSGGILLFDDFSEKGDREFYNSALAFMRGVFPEIPGPAPVPRDHAVYQSYYLLKEPRGRLNKEDYLEGWTSGDRTSVFFSHNDLLGALEADRLGSWKYSMEIGGGFRRELSFRLGINLTYYALTINYKKDRAFPPIIERRRRI